MGIPEQQLETWSHHGSTARASAIYERIRNALEGDPQLARRNIEVFLQGSYRNNTNIYGDSDVDVVVKLNDVFVPGYDRLDSETRGRIQAQTEPADYTFLDFRQEVASAIRRSFPNHDITEGGKCIKIPRTPNNIPADVVPCLEYRLYNPPGGALSRAVFSIDANYVEGIWLRDIRSEQAHVNFPKRHYDRGVSKNRHVNNCYKPTVRIFKNANHNLERLFKLSPGVATSYGIECLLYNVPDSQFKGSHQETFTAIAILYWLSCADLTKFTCQNGIQRLFEADRWRIEHAKRYIEALNQLWMSWGRNARVRL